MFKLKTNKRWLILGIVMLVTVILTLICVANESILFSKNLEKPENNAPTVSTTNGNFGLESSEIITKAGELLGKPYKFGNKGYDGNIYEVKFKYEKLYQASQIGIQTDKPGNNDGIDCSGLIYWTLSQLGATTQNFDFQNPVPVDTVHWVTYKNNPTITANGILSNINVLKKSESVTDSLRYYEYMDGTTKKVLPAGTIVVSITESGEAYNHSWICLGNLGTTSPTEVQKILTEMGLKNIPEGTIKKVNDNCTYWRIESAGNAGVVINNADLNEGANDGGKKIGKIWAFQVANEINGSYKLNIQKVDSKGNPIKVNNISDVFSAKYENGNNLNIDYATQSTIEYKPIQITASNVKNDDVIIIKENIAPLGYEKYDKEIKLVIEKNTYTDNNNRTYYTGNIKEVYINGTKDEGVNGYYDNGNVLINLDNGKITVKVKNSKVDLALKKTITKVTTNDITDDVTTDNGFNVGRDESKFSIDSTDLKNGTSTNAKYTMNKTPVEILKGDIVEYSIRIYNEGEVPAKAIDVNDYIPVGLEVLEVYHQNTQITQTSDTIDNKDLASVNYYKYNKANGVLNIHLGAANLIDSYNSENNTLSSDYILVKCKVLDTAEGILTNVAEIRNYYTQSGVFTKDIDSISDNWESPNGDGRTETDKSTQAWRDYSNKQSNLLDGDWHEFIAQDNGLNGNKGDDDDFDKIKVLEKYNLVIKKVDESNNPVTDVQFDITRNNYDKMYMKKSVKNIKESSVIPTEGLQFEEVIYPNESLITYVITELENDEYIQLAKPLYLYLNVKNGKVVSYKLNEENDESNNFMDSNSELYFSSTASETKLKVSTEFSENNIVLTISNIKPTNGNYTINLNKVSSGNNQPLGGVTFNTKVSVCDVNGIDITTPQSIQKVTDSTTGTVELINKEINKDNYEEIDRYVIDEINLGTNAGYTKMESDIEIKAFKQLKDSKYQFEKYEVNIIPASASVKVTKTKAFTFVEENGVRFWIMTNALLTGSNNLTIVVTNVPDNQVPLQIRKVSAEDEATIITGTDFTITRGDVTLFDEIDTTGKIILTDNLEAAMTNVQYKIVENSAADKYDNVLYNKYIILTVTLTNGIPSDANAKVYNADNTENTELSSVVTASIQDIDLVKTVDLKIKNPESVKTIDLALKKQITHINGIKVNDIVGLDEKYSRDPIATRTYPLVNGKYDAAYFMNKTPILVQKGAIVKYQIRIYNESFDEPATASKITDYLPNGLELLNVYYKDSETPLAKGTDYTYDAENNVIVITALENKDLIPEFDGGTKVPSDYVTVECKVLDTAEGILTNVAEISEYKTEIGKINEDRDSFEDNWKNPNDNNSNNNETTDRTTSDWVNYAGDEANVIEDGEMKNYIGQEDDDDFEKILVGEVDLVLKKIITNINDTSVDTLAPTFHRLDNITIDTVEMNKNANVTTAKYYLNKTPIHVKVNDTVTYEIRIYNEGSIDATASEITDYIPKGLQLVSVSYNNNVLTQGIEYTVDTNNVLKITAMKNNLIDKYFENEYNFTEPSYDKVIVTCKVDGTIRGLLSNVAEISKYQTILGEINTDRDSQTVGNGEWQEPEGTNKLTLDGKSGAQWAHYRDDFSANSYGKFVNWAGQQDDDDFEKILVTTGYTLQLHKISRIDKNLSGISNVEYDISGEKYVTGENGYTALTEIKELLNANMLDTYVIKEANTNSNYSKLLNPIYFAVVKSQNSIGTVNISGFKVNFQDGNFANTSTHSVDKIEFTNGTFTKTFHTVDINGKMVDVIINITEDKANVGNYSFVIEIENTIPESIYDLYIKKIDEKGNALNNVKFNIKAFVEYAFEKDTISNGNLTYITTQRIHENNYSSKDIYEIEEIETVDNYIKLDNPLKLEVTKKISMETQKYEIDSMQLFYKDKQSSIGKEIVIEDIPVGSDNQTVDITAKLTEQKNEQTGEVVPAIVVTIPNEKITGKYTILIRKVSSKDLEPLEGAKFAIKEVNTNGAPYETEVTNNLGITTLLQDIKVTEPGEDKYTITETYAPDKYALFNGELTLTAVMKQEDNGYVLDKQNTKIEGGNATISVDDLLITITMPNDEKEFDLSLRKFITKVNDTELTGENSREPVVNLNTLKNGDPAKNGEKTAIYTHTKEPLTVCPSDIVEYTLRVYNEGELDGYARRVMDSVPAGVEMISPLYDKDGNATNQNAQYRWKMYKAVEGDFVEGYIYYNGKYYAETVNSQEAEIIVTDYLSKANGELMMKPEDTENPNLLKAFNGPDNELSYKDIKVQFKVKTTNKPEDIITNYAQISEDEYKDATDITDRDSTPNEWKENEDDQDVEHIKVKYFDLALYKWASSTIVIEDGKTKEVPSGHTQDYKDKVVNVTISKEKLDKTVVKFKYQIKVENEGTLAGYAKELKDHIPQGLKFIEADNTEFGWKQQQDGTITTDYLKDTLLQPEDSAEVTVVLTWINGENNLGQKVNFAEISEDYNEYDDTPDIDSTPNNFEDEPDEDDEDKDLVMLNIKTGETINAMYVAIIAGVAAIVVAGIVAIKKYVI